MSIQAERDEFSNSNMYLISTFNGWDLIATMENREPLHHEYFLVMNEQSEKEVGPMIEKINREKTFGRGLEFDFDERWPSGVKLNVELGWRLTELQGRLLIRKLQGLLV